MKKVLLTKTQCIQRVSSGTDLILKQTAPVVVAVGPAPLKSSTYTQRKAFLPVYKDIIREVMRIPDKDIQQRLIDAINGPGSDKISASTSRLNKQCCCGATKVSASTQTDDEPRIPSPSTPYRNHATPNTLVKGLIKNDSLTGVPSPSPIPSPSPAQSMPLKVAKKRGRKRNTCVPQVVKVSAAEMAQQEREVKQLTPVITKKRKLEVPERKRKEEDRPALERRSSTMSDVSINVAEGFQYVDSYIENGMDNEKLIRIMAMEFQKARILSLQGLLPIHDDILDGDIYGVRRQIFVCKYSNFDINEMISADGEDCLELALTNDREPDLVTALLTAGCLPNHIYENGNTALHIAVINNIDRESIRQLMLRIDLDLLLQTNDAGYTALHLAVRHNQYHVAETILDCIDERQLEGGAVYRRATETTDSKLTPEKAFAKYYERACDRLETTKHVLKDRRLKLDILNAAELMAGNTLLFFAVEQEQEHICYFLLAHLCDPDQENLSGHSPKSFHYEYARILRINLKISRVMDKVIGILNG
ncbi:uncharacterized protein LOC108161766 [Drosophila miranda]|uniref:uncharacterized protein LOC108161766 n=1 Tax=Drosophila miranda TaxID=7229 RepID=UPI0007E88A1B|nr:uncharacterized protein LOC108161766 [Drosophila miranda]